MRGKRGTWRMRAVSLALAGMLAAGGAAALPVMPAQAETTYINDDQRAAADAEMVYYKERLIARENPEQYILDKLEDILYSGIYYIAYTETLTESDMWAYVAQIKGEMDAAVAESGEPTTTTEFLAFADNWTTPTVSYGQSVSIVLPLINLGEEELTDLLVEPVISNDVSEWPFKPDSTGYTQNFSEIPGCATKLYDEAYFNRRELTYTFTARDDVLTGYYPLTFEVWYSKDGIRCEEPVELTVYVYCQGKPGSGKIGSSEQTNVSQPRIIVTGFETDPEEIYAGDTFTLTIHVKNTSPDTAVNNVLFDLQAVEGGTESSNGTVTNSYAAFLPTSGSSSVYFNSIPAGGSTDLVMEMEAKADLSQKPYVVTVKMKYDTEQKADLTDEAKVSVPVRQVSKFDASTPEINPASILVGEQSNVMFQIYNTGKTTLYNVQVKFEADSVTGGDSFLGNLAPGATGNVDAMVTGVAPTMDDGTVTAVVIYEDEAGNQTRMEKQIELFVSEMPADDGIYEMPEDDGTQQGNTGLWITVGVIAGIVVVVLIVVIAALRIRKKKKAAKELREDLDALEADESK
ncbi:MAG: CARDB domain-containing protein [Eubacteriales bacterium]|nr:CARDB domain-containing protein [Eubacteriales bacterium]